MKENTIRITITRPVSEVFEFTTDPKNTPLWISSVKEELASHYPPKLGTEYKNRGSGRDWSFYNVVELDENSLFTLAASDGNYSVRYTYNSISRNETELEYHEWVNDGEIQDPFKQEVLLKLKSVMEAKPSEKADGAEVKLLLTSAGLSNPKITNEFLNLVNKKPAEIKLLFIPTAAEREKDRSYIDKAITELLDAGLRNDNIQILNLDHKIAYAEVRDFDAILVNGGNTFYLLHKVRESGFDKIVKQFLKNGKVYFGISAGSYIACPTIEMALWKRSNKNEIGLKDLTGLSLVPFLMTVHFEPKYGADIKEGIGKTGYPTRILTDEQALAINDGEVRLIGEGKQTIIEA